MTVDIQPAHLVGLGGAVGAVLRHVVGQRVAGAEFPTGTLVVNVLGTFVLGFVTFLGSADGVLLFVGTGACGAFTTFSSFSFETVRLWEEGDPLRAATNGLVNLVGAGLALALAWWLSTALG